MLRSECRVPSPGERPRLRRGRAHRPRSQRLERHLHKQKDSDYGLFRPWQRDPRNAALRRRGECLRDHHSARPCGRAPHGPAFLQVLLQRTRGHSCGHLLHAAERHFANAQKQAGGAPYSTRPRTGPMDRPAPTGDQGDGARGDRGLDRQGRRPQELYPCRESDLVQAPDHGLQGCSCQVTSNLGAGGVLPGLDSRCRHSDRSSHHAMGA
mmetsp:Transcript_62687/g.149608  ORF Transcript_62687/g.149608 Transcript_62687/m.149608 type:complete len:210 (-) Transcript_62687:2177-2806(-)